MVIPFRPCTKLQIHIWEKASQILLEKSMSGKLKIHEKVVTHVYELIGWYSKQIILIEKVFKKF